MSDYFSFLVCRHPDHTDVYITGMPLAVIRNGVATIGSKLKFKDAAGRLAELEPVLNALADAMEAWKENETARPSSL